MLFNKHGNVFISFIILYIIFYNICNNIIFFIYQNIGLIFVFLTHARITHIIKQGIHMIDK